MNCVASSPVELHPSKNHHQSPGEPTWKSIQRCTLENRSVGKDEYGYLEMAVNIQVLYCCIAFRT